MKRGIPLTLLVALAALPAPVVTQDTAEPDPLAAKAAELFAYEEGTWASRWEILDEEGNVVSEFEGTEAFAYTMDGKAMTIETRNDASPDWSQGVRFYSPQDREIVFLNWTTAGDHWIMRQDVESWVVRSEPKTLPDGREILLRFTIVRKTETEQDVIMEVSTDGGEAWWLRTRQYLRRE